MAVVTRILVELVPFKPPYSLMLSKFIACCQCLAAPASKLTSTASWTAGLAKALGAGLTRTLYYVHDLVSAAAPLRLRRCAALCSVHLSKQMMA